MRKSNSKLNIKRETIRSLSNLDEVVGGVDTGSGFSCLGGCNTVFRCADTDAASNCNCGPQSFQCPSVSCPPRPL